jgi:hypothetical protein
MKLEAQPQPHVHHHHLSSKQCTHNQAEHCHTRKKQSLISFISNQQVLNTRPSFSHPRPPSKSTNPPLHHRQRAAAGRKKVQVKTSIDTPNFFVASFSLSFRTHVVRGLSSRGRPGLVKDDEAVTVTARPVSSRPRSEKNSHNLTNPDAVRILDQYRTDTESRKSTTSPCAQRKIFFLKKTEKGRQEETGALTCSSTQTPPPCRYSPSSPHKPS